MKKSMIDYINTLSGDNFETFENIILNQYRKFVKFYKLVSSYSSEIESLEYKFEENCKLEVYLTFKTENNARNIFIKLSNLENEDGLLITITQSFNKIYVVLTMDESNLV